VHQNLKHMTSRKGAGKIKRGRVKGGKDFNRCVELTDDINPNKHICDQLI
jgi:hypothetical protein